MPCEWVYDADAVDFVAEEFDADGFAFGLGLVDFDDVATDSEFASGEGGIVAFVEEVHEFCEEGFSGEALADFECDEHLEEVFWGTEAVDAGDAGDDDGIASGEE